jgi:hypothetical protein
MLAKGVHGNLQCGQIPGSLFCEPLFEYTRLAVVRDIKGEALG